MNWFYSIVTAISATSILAGALYVLCPDGEMSKSLKYVFSLCFLLSIISVAGIKINPERFKINTALPDINEYQTVKTAEAIYGTALKNAGIVFEEISVDTDISDNSSIIINRITVVSDESREKITDALGQAAENYEVEIINDQNS